MFIFKSQAQVNKIRKFMREFKAGKLKDPQGNVISDRKQAIAVAMSEAGLAKSMSKKQLLTEHKRLIRVLRSGNKKLQDKEADIQEKELSEYVEKALQKAQYTGPISAADQNLYSCTEFLREGGSFNYPAWIDTDKMNNIRHNFDFLAKLHK